MWVDGYWRSHFTPEETRVTQLLGCLKMQSVASLDRQDCLGWLGTSLLNLGPARSNPFKKPVWVLLCIHRQPDTLGKSPSPAAPSGPALPSHARHGTSSLTVPGCGTEAPGRCRKGSWQRCFGVSCSPPCWLMVALCPPPCRPGREGRGVGVTALLGVWLSPS